MYFCGAKVSLLLWKEYRIQELKHRNREKKMNHEQDILEPGSSLHSYYDLGKVKKIMHEEDSMWLQTVYRERMGEVRSFYIDGGRDFMFADYRQSIERNTLIKTEVQDHTTVEMSFMMRMDNLTDRVNGKLTTYNSMRQNMHYVAPGSSVELYCRKDASYHNFDVYLDMKTLIKWELNYRPLDNFINSIQQKQTANLFKEEIPVTAATQCVLNEIKRCSMTGIARNIYMKGKVFELLAHQINHSERKEKLTGKQITSNFQLEEYDLDIIQKIARDIESNSKPFATIQDFSRFYGINEHKLKNGFKAIIGKPIFEYAESIRMDKARNLLMHSSKPIKEIAYEIGYKTPIAFTMAFKRHCGMLPKDFRAEGKSSIVIDNFLANYRTTD